MYNQKKRKGKSQAVFALCYITNYLRLLLNNKEALTTDSIRCYLGGGAVVAHVFGELK